MIISKLIYPPIIDNRMPAFVKKANNETKCRVYFSFSDKNSISEIKSILVNVNYQITNRTALDLQKWPTGIKIINVKDQNGQPQVFEDKTKVSSDRFYIELSDEDLQKGFVKNIYYKVQLCFSQEEYNENTSLSIASWIRTNEQHFSEWSTFCLLKCIAEPYLTFKNITNDTEEKIDIGNYILSSNGDISATLKFRDEEQSGTEYLNLYYFKLKDANGNILLETKPIYCREQSSINEINYHLKYNFVSNTNYQLEIYYETNNGYSKTLKYDFHINYFYADKLNITLDLENSNDLGYISIKIKDNTIDTFFGQLIITRASNQDNFNLWEDVHIASLYDNKPINYVWNDYSVESGVIYRYRVQKFNKETKTRGVPTESSISGMVILEDMFLNDAERQLKIKFNPKIDSFKFIVQENKIETLGGKYPIIRKNGLLKYRQFPISGLISFLMDDEEQFFRTNEDVLTDEEGIYSIYNNAWNITDLNDTNKEKIFRDKVISFLYDDKVKLFRSATEGNILVKLSDISFKPENQLGRHIYTFSATANEIANNTFENYIENKVITLEPLITDNLLYERIQMGQIILPYILNDSGTVTWDLIEALKDKYQLLAPQNHDVLDINLSMLQIYTVKKSDGTPLESYSFCINSTDQASAIISNQQPKNFFDKDYQINKFFIITNNNSPTYTINYIAKVTYQELAARSASIEYITKIGQLKGLFSCSDPLYSYIKEKYDYDYSDKYQKVIDIPYLHIEAQPNTVFYVKDNMNDIYFNRHVIGLTGSLDFSQKKTSISNLLIAGEFLNTSKFYRFKLKSDAAPTMAVYSQTFQSNSNPIYKMVYEINQQSNTINQVYARFASLSSLQEAALDRIELFVAQVNTTTNSLINHQPAYQYKTSNRMYYDGIKIADNIDIITPDYIDEHGLPLLIDGCIYCLDTLTSFENNIIKSVIQSFLASDLNIEYQNFIINKISSPWKSPDDEDDEPSYYHFLYKDKNWYVVTDTYDIICPKNISLTYQCNLIRGVYY